MTLAGKLTKAAAATSVAAGASVAGALPVAADSTETGHATNTYHTQFRPPGFDTTCNIDYSFTFRTNEASLRVHAEIGTNTLTGTYDGCRLADFNGPVPEARSHTFVRAIYQNTSHQTVTSPWFNSGNTYVTDALVSNDVLADSPVRTEQYATFEGFNCTSGCTSPTYVLEGTASKF